MKTAIIVISLCLYGLIPGIEVSAPETAIVSVSKPSETWAGAIGRDTPQRAAYSGFLVDGATPGLCTQWWPTALRAGWQIEDLRTLDFVMYRESKCRPYSHNPDDPFGGSFGLMQVNGGWRGWLRERGVVKRRSDLMIPDINLRAARLIWEYAKEKHDNGWNPWNG